MRAPEATEHGRHAARRVGTHVVEDVAKGRGEGGLGGFGKDLLAMASNLVAMTSNC